MKKLKFHLEAIIRDRYEPASLTENEVREWLLNMQKQDILKVETENDYWEDIPQDLFELFKTNIKDKNYEYTIAKGKTGISTQIFVAAFGLLYNNSIQKSVGLQITCHHNKAHKYQNTNTKNIETTVISKYFL